MKKNICRLFVLITFFALCACSKEVVMKPTPLSKFQQTTVIHQQWSNSVSMGKGAYLKLAPAFANNKAFIAGNSGKIKAIDTGSGKTLWQTSTTAPISSGIGTNSNLLFVGTADGRVLALQQQDGKLVWQAKIIGDVLSAPTANNDIVVAKTEIGNIRAFQASNGQLLWSFNHANPSLILRGSSAPKIVGDQVICGFANGEMMAFALETGNIRWQQQVTIPSGSFLVERMVDIIADPVVSGNIAYVVAYQGSITAINIKNGNILWQKPMSSISGLTVDTQNIYVSNSSDQLWALSKNDGDTLWHQDIFAYRGLSGPAVLNNLVAVGDVEGYVHWMNTSNGQMAARTKISGGIVVAPVVYNNAMYVYSATGSLVKFTK